jgi:hypothetical protein
VDLDLLTDRTSMYGEREREGERERGREAVCVCVCVNVPVGEWVYAWVYGWICDSKNSGTCGCMQGRVGLLRDMWVY